MEGGREITETRIRTPFGEALSILEVEASIQKGKELLSAARAKGMVGTELSQGPFYILAGGATDDILPYTPIAHIRIFADEAGKMAE